MYPLAAQCKCKRFYVHGETSCPFPKFFHPIPTLLIFFHTPIAYNGAYVPIWSKSQMNIILLVATPDEGELLNKEKCLEALASLRHAKWFQVRHQFLYYISHLLRFYPWLKRKLGFLTIICKISMISPKNDAQSYEIDCFCSKHFTIVH